MLHIIIDDNKNSSYGNFNEEHIEKLFNEYKDKIVEPYETGMEAVVVQSHDINIVKEILKYARYFGVDTSNIIVDNKISSSIEPISSYSWLL